MSIHTDREGLGWAIMIRCTSLVLKLGLAVVLFTQRDVYIYNCGVVGAWPRSGIRHAVAETEKDP